MDGSVTVEYRKVRNLRLEFGKQGLRVIVPLGFSGSVDDILKRHSNWIARRQKKFQQLHAASAHLPLENRTDQLLRILIGQLLEKSTATLQAYPKLVKYRAMKTRWGSCSSAGVITFSTRLKFLPEGLVAFVVHHEVTHLRVMRHDAKFWKLMADAYPDWKQLRKQLHLYAAAVL